MSKIFEDFVGISYSYQQKNYSCRSKMVGKNVAKRKMSSAVCTLAIYKLILSTSAIKSKGMKV